MTTLERPVTIGIVVSVAGDHAYLVVDRGHCDVLLVVDGYLWRRLVVAVQSATTVDAI